MDAQFKIFFPNISNIKSKKTSDCDGRYNCIAWAFKDNRRNWWPSPRRSYWPLVCAGKSTMEAFEEWFTSESWEETDNPDFEIGFEKIALYAKDGEPTHAARLLNNGLWTSKLGASIDISHQLSDLDGPVYGTVIRIYKKPI